MRQRSALFVAILWFWGCGEAKAPERKEERHFESGIPATFVVIHHEAPPRGFSPAPLETGPRLSKIEGSGVVTLALRRRLNTKDFGRRDSAGPERIEHVDDSAPVISADGDILEYGKEHTYVIPIVGPRGERLSQAYRIKMGDDPTLAKVGDPMPRVHVRNDGLTRLFVYGDEPDLILTVTKDYRVSKPPRGVLGGKPVGSHVLVRWDGERGEGWSLAVGTDASEMKDAGPVWKVVRQARLSEGPVVAGERIDGAGCDVTFVKFDWDMRVEPTRTPACDDALFAMETKMKEVRLAKDVASAKDEAERQAKRAARLAAEKKADAERADQTRKEEEQQKKEAPILAEYDEALKKQDLRLACTIASSHFDSKRHARHALQRWAQGGSPAEIRCALDRVQDPALKTTLQWAYERAENEQSARWKAQQENAPRERKTGVWSSWGAGGAGGTSSSSSSSHQDYMNRVNDFVYGSGKASSCPFEDWSRCK